MDINLFWANVPFLYLYEIIRKLSGFVIFSEGMQMEHLLNTG